jgi:hypothetical protein
MQRVVLIGLERSTVDYADPAIPPGMTAERTSAGITRTLSASIAFNTVPEDSGEGVARWIRD